MQDRMRDEIEWDDKLDALVAAPEHHRLLWENEQVRVIETHIPAGERTAVHTHRWPGVLRIVSWSAFIRYDDRGNILVESRNVPELQNPPQYVWSVALPPHSLENVGDNELRVVAVELKGSREALELG
jgi:hypothetical protein